MEFGEDSDVLLDRLYEISGGTRTPDSKTHQIVLHALVHPREEIRERAIFIGGLRWMDERFIELFRHALIEGTEQSPSNCARMIECLVSHALFRWGDREILKQFIQTLLRRYDRDSEPAKAGYVGIKRLEGLISPQDFALTDYEEMDIPESDWLDAIGGRDVDRG